MENVRALFGLVSDCRSIFDSCKSIGDLLIFAFTLITGLFIVVFFFLPVSLIRDLLAIKIRE